MSIKTLWDRWKARDRRCAEAKVLASWVGLDIALQNKAPPAMVAILRTGFGDPRPSEQIAAAVELRRMLLSMQSHDRSRLVRTVYDLRDRYAVALGPTAAERYARTQPDLTDANLEIDQLRGEASSLLEQLKLAYTLSSERDMLLNRMRKTALGLLAFLFLALVAVKAIANREAPVEWVNEALNVAVICVIGASGAMVSLLRRTENVAVTPPSQVDPVRQLSALGQGMVAVFVSGFVGAAVALVMLAAFATGPDAIGKIIPGLAEALVPKFQPCMGQEGCFTLMDVRMQFSNMTESAKMLVWAFIAGFAEKFVPDILDRLTKVASGVKKTEAT